MENKDKEKLEVAISTLAGKVDRSIDSNDALKYTQAALNLAHVVMILFKTD